jgi:hypothetical protein
MEIPYKFKFRRVFFQVSTAPAEGGSTATLYGGCCDGHRKIECSDRLAGCVNPFRNVDIYPLRIYKLVLCSRLRRRSFTF